MRRSPESVSALLDELDPAVGNDAFYDAALRALRDLLPTIGAEVPETAARPFASLAARLFAASRLLRLAPPEVAALYCATRLGTIGDRTLGELPAGYPVRDIVAAVTPAAPGQPIG